MSNSSGVVPDWTLITVTFNSSKALRAFWSPPPSNVEWIVVDNNSSDDTVAVASELGASVISLDENVGFGAANNVGFRQAKASAVGFINPDVSVDFQTLPALLQVVNQGRRLVAPQLLNSDGSQQPNGRGFPLAINKLRNRTGEAAKLINQYLLFARPGEVRRVCWLIGAVVLSQREVFDDIDVWDDRFFIYYEDSDICLRGWEKGVESVLVGDVRWVHGWARETTSFTWAPWKHELVSMAKFYARYPVLALGNRFAARRYPTIAGAIEADGWRWRS